MKKKILYTAIIVLIIVMLSCLIFFIKIKKAEDEPKEQLIEESSESEITGEVVLDEQETNINEVENVENQEQNIEESGKQNIVTIPNNNTNVVTNTNNTNSNNNTQNNTNNATTQTQNAQKEKEPEPTPPKQEKIENTITEPKEDVYTFKKNDAEIQNMISIAKRIIRENKDGRCDGLVNQVDSINFVVAKAGNLFYPLFDYRIENIVIDNFFPEFYVYAEDVYKNGEYLRTEYYFN